MRFVKGLDLWLLFLVLVDCFVLVLDEFLIDLLDVEEVVVFLVVNVCVFCFFCVCIRCFWYVFCFLLNVLMEDFEGLMLFMDGVWEVSVVVVFRVCMLEYGVIEVV